MDIVSISQLQGNTGTLVDSLNPKSELRSYIQVTNQSAADYVSEASNPILESICYVNFLWTRRVTNVFIIC
jgi:hypothetical protein